MVLAVQALPPIKAGHAGRAAAGAVAVTQPVPAVLAEMAVADLAAVVVVLHELILRQAVVVVVAMGML